MIASPRWAGPTRCVAALWIAIFDMGSRQPFLVCWQQEPGSGDAVGEVLGCEAYSVLEFDA